MWIDGFLCCFYAFACGILLLRVTYANEYCNYDTFQAECPEGHVIEIQNATYGRMNVGKCIKSHYKMDCFKGVTREMDVLCSGKQMCNFQVIDALHTVKPCEEGLAPYLYTTHKCIKVESYTEMSCSSDNIQLPDSSITQISSDSDTPTCQTPTYRFATKPGQSIEIYLFDFTTSEQHMQSSCQVLGYVTESVIRTNRTICSPHTDRGALVYKSVGYTIEMTLLKADQRQSKGIFMLKYKVLGCPDIPISHMVHYTRDGSSVKLGCSENDDERWSVHCENNHWTGEYENCSDAGSDNLGKPGSGMMSFFVGLPEGVSLAIIIGVAVLLSILVLTCGFMYIASQKSSSPESTSETYSHGPRRTDSEFKMYAGPTLRKSQEFIDTQKPILYHDTMDQNIIMHPESGNVETCSCASYSSIPKIY